MNRDYRAAYAYGRIPTAGNVGYIMCSWADCDRDARAEIRAEVATEKNPPVSNTYLFCCSDHRLYWLNSPRPQAPRYT